jgi:hypothetical protein
MICVGLSMAFPSNHQVRTLRSATYDAWSSPLSLSLLDYVLEARNIEVIAPAEQAKGTPD